MRHAARSPRRTWSRRPRAPSSNRLTGRPAKVVRLLPMVMAGTLAGPPDSFSRVGREQRRCQIPARGEHVVAGSDGPGEALAVRTRQLDPRDPPHGELVAEPG